MNAPILISRPGRPGPAAADVVALDVVTPVGGRRYSTAELLAIDTRIVESPNRRAGQRVGVVPVATLERALAGRPSLSDEQRAMVARLTMSGAGIDVVVGRAGAGKTFALDAARSAWQAAGHPVIGAALAARAAAELESGAGIASTTIDRLLIDLEAPGPMSGLAAGSVVVVDEAGMVGTRKLARLLDAAERDRAKVVLVGDPRQLPEIDAGRSVRRPGRPARHRRTRRQPPPKPTMGTPSPHRAAVRIGRQRGRRLPPGRPGQPGRSADAARDAVVSDWWAAREA